MAKYAYRQAPPRKIVVIRPHRKSRFKWGIVLIPGAVLLVLWLASGISLGFQWNDVMNALHVHDRHRYSQLAILGLVAVGVVSVARILRQDGDERKDK